VGTWLGAFIGGLSLLLFNPMGLPPGIDPTSRFAMFLIGFIPGAAIGRFLVDLTLEPPSTAPPTADPAASVNQLDA
jgi:hypothetical protein